ncbi:hypothetical protein [Demequina mangrovi]|uniref:Uncharacterized protein n=1 Tax=Demequina mangrovi TaxID=1043493 RepID=A0A1H6YM39_9MICO|nr:hypothetical protein [Demequina mangrovi]SEJ40007.1 hypothetical protein SAMN05421637_1717 [Demequina mangrovi]
MAPEPAESREISRRHVIIGAAWVTPAVLIATGSPPAAASLENPLDGSYVESIESANDDLYRATIRLPEGTVLEGATLTVNWVPTNDGASVQVETGSDLWDPGNTNASSVVFIAPGPISDADTFLVRFDKGMNGSAWTALLEGTVDGQDASAFFTGTL